MMMMPHGRKSSLGPAALHFLSRQLQTDCSESFERAAPSAKSASPPAARRKIQAVAAHMAADAGVCNAFVLVVFPRASSDNEQRQSEQSLESTTIRGQIWSGSSGATR